MLPRCSQLSEGAEKKERLRREMREGEMEEGEDAILEEGEDAIFKICLFFISNNFNSLSKSESQLN